MIAGYTLVLTALAIAPLAGVAPLRESATLLAAGWGVLRLGERDGAAWRLAGAACIATGRSCWRWAAEGRDRTRGGRPSTGRAASPDCATQAEGAPAAAEGRCAFGRANPYIAAPNTPPARHRIVTVPVVPSCSRQ